VGDKYKSDFDFSLNALEFNLHGLAQLIEYLVVTAGSYDFLAEVVVRDEGELLEATNAIRATPGVTSTETFVYLELVKQTFTWGVH